MHIKAEADHQFEELHKNIDSYRKILITSSCYEKIKKDLQSTPFIAYIHHRDRELLSLTVRAHNSVNLFHSITGNVCNLFFALDLIESNLITMRIPFSISF